VAACVKPHVSTVSRIAIIISARAFMFAACSREGSMASHTLSNFCFFIVLLGVSIPLNALHALQLETRIVPRLIGKRT
jgi:hypothetical protein